MAGFGSFGDAHCQPEMSGKLVSMKQIVIKIVYFGFVTFVV